MAGCVQLLLFLPVLHWVEPSAFLSASEANEVLVRRRRAGSYLLEELFEGNLEKECYEEICVYEEAREVFENDAITEDFWGKYMGGSPCISQPCLNNGSCQNHVRSYTCTCSSGYEGRTCAFAKNECHPLRTDGCQHFCHPGQDSYMCSCAKGYKLGQDHKSCIPHEKCACGVLNSECNLTALKSKQNLPIFPWQLSKTHYSSSHPSALRQASEHGAGHRWMVTVCNRTCTIRQWWSTSAKSTAFGLPAHSREPWLPFSSIEVVLVPTRPGAMTCEVKLTNSQGKDFCGGVIIQENFVLTTAKCSLLHRNISVKTNFPGAGKDPLTVKVKSTHVHMRYEEETGDNDISLLELELPIQCPDMGLPICMPERDFAERVLIPGTRGLLVGWALNGSELGNAPTQLPVTHTDSEECGTALNVTVTTRTYCERGAAAGGVQWAEGSVVARKHKGTWFLTGILCSVPTAESGPEFLLTRVSRYSLWFTQIMK